MPNPGKPPALKLLEGEHVAIPPTPPGRPPKPIWKEITDERVRSRARAEYKRLVGLLDQVGALASIDLMTIHAAAVAYASWRVALMDEDGTAARSWMRLAIQHSAKLGLSPLDRQKLIFPRLLSERERNLRASHVLD